MKNAKHFMTLSIETVSVLTFAACGEVSSTVPNGDYLRAGQLQDELERREASLLVLTRAIATCETRVPPKVLCVTKDPGASQCKAAY